MGSLTASVADNYYEALGLAFDPFADDAMPEFFFVGGQRRFLVQRAVHRLYFSGGMVLVLGADGAGKTRLLDEISAELRDIADICRIDATVLMDGAQIRVLLADAMRLQPGAAFSAPDLVAALSHARPGHGEPLPVVLLIDSAHSLSIEALVETATLVQSAGGRLRLLLAGENDLATSWQQANVGAAEALQLPALDRQEVADYLHTRLQAAGAKFAMPLESSVLDELFAQSGGSIGAIHALAPRLLAPTPMLAQNASLPTRIKALPILHIGAIAALLTVVIILILYRGTGNAPKVEDAKSSPKSSFASGDKQTLPLALPNPRPPAESISPAPAQITAPARNETAVAVVPVPSRTIAPEPAKRPEPKAIQPVAKLVPAQPAVTPATASKSPISAAQEPVSPALSVDERDLLGLPPQQFMLQLLGGESFESVEKFKTTAGNDLRIFVCRTQSHGKTWFVALIGPYPTKVDAQAAALKLPELLRKQQPWPRSLASLQVELRTSAGKQ